MNPGWMTFFLVVAVVCALAAALSENVALTMFNLALCVFWLWRIEQSEAAS